jgi:hypothetical protein
VESITRHEGMNGMVKEKPMPLCVDGNCRIADLYGFLYQPTTDPYRSS